MAETVEKKFTTHREHRKVVARDLAAARKAREKAEEDGVKAREDREKRKAEARAKAVKETK